MEKLFVYALLYSEGFDMWAMYSNTLDKLFIENPEDEMKKLEDEQKETNEYNQVIPNKLKDNEDGGIDEE